MKTAIIYARVSTSKQANDGLPISSQIDQARAKACAMGAEVLRVFKDEGISGRTAQRPAFQEALAFCAARKVDWFVCWSTSRFARNKIDAAECKIRLKAAGTRVVYVTSDVDTSTIDGWFSDSIMEVVDEVYSRQISRDTLRSLMKNARDGFFNGGRLPVGYTAVSDGPRRRLVIVEHEAFVIRRVFSLYLAGAGCKEVSMQLNAAGQLRRGQRWSKNSVAATLKNERYAGITVFNRHARSEGRDRPESEWVRTPSHEAIIDMDTFEKVQALFKLRTASSDTGSPHSMYAFTGLLRCSACGAAMMIETATGRSRLYSYYNCSAALKGRGCSNRRIRADLLDVWLIDKILDELFTPARMAELLQEIHELAGSWIDERRAARANVVRQVRAAEARRDKLFEVMELHGKEAPNLGHIGPRLQQLRAEIEQLELQLTAIEEAPDLEVLDVDATALAHFLGNLIRSEDAPNAARPHLAVNHRAAQRRAFFSRCIEAITIDGDHVKIVYKADRLVNPEGFSVHSRVGWLPDHRVLPTETWTLPRGLRVAA